MKKRLHYLLTLFIIAFLSLLFMETAFRLFSGDQIFTFIFLRISVFDLTGALMIAFIASFFNRRKSRKILLFVFFALAAYAIFQLTWLTYMQRFFTMQDTTYGAEKVVAYAIDFILSINLLHFIILLPWLLILRYYHPDHADKPGFSFSYLFLGTLVILILHGASLGLLFIGNDPDQLNTPYEIYTKAEHSSEAVHQIGVFRYLVRDAVNFLDPTEEEIVIIPEDEPETTINDPEATDNTAVIDDTQWQELIDAETNEDITTIDNYLINRTSDTANDMTGIFAGKNLILVMVEAFDYMAIDEALTPTLYKMMQEGWFFDNFYSPQYACATGQSEFTALTSLVPETNSCTINNYAGNDYYQSLFNLFNNADYYSSSYHNWTDQYYDRTEFHASLYSDHFYNYDELPFDTIQGWQSDYELFELALPYFIDEDSYFSFIITSSTHFPYDTDSTLGDRYLAEIDEIHPDYPIEVKRYLSKAMELDRGLAYLLNTLEASGEAEDTVIVLYGDHHPLKIDTAYFTEYSYGDVDRSTIYGESCTPFIIYNSELTPTTFSEPMSTVDITPTLANLFGLEHDSRLYLGNDYFSDNEKIVYFANGSWLCQYGFYNSELSAFESFSDSDPDIEYLNGINNSIKNLFNISKLIYLTDYFRYRHDIVFPV